VHLLLNHSSLYLGKGVVFFNFDVMSKVRANGDSGSGEASGSKPSKEGYDFSKSGEVLKKVTEMRFNFGPKDSQSVAVDQTLATLFETLSVECSRYVMSRDEKVFEGAHNRCQQIAQFANFKFFVGYL